MDYKRIIEAALHNDPSLPCATVYDNTHTRVYKVGTPDPLIVRISQGDKASYQFQTALLEEVAAQDDLSVRILYWETREIGNHVYGIQVQTFIPGKPVEHYPTGGQSKAIVNAIYKLQQRLCTATGKFGTDSIQNIHNIIKQRYPLVNDCPIKTAADQLFEQGRYLELVSQPEQCVIHGDLWYRNIHLEGLGNKTEVRLIDFEPLILGPDILQPAILFSSYFLLNIFFLEPHSQQLFDLDKLISYWPECLNKGDVLLMMLVFPIALGLLKEYRFSQVSNLDPQTRRLTMEPFEKSVQMINRLLKENK